MYFKNTISNLAKVVRAKFLGSGKLFCFISEDKFGGFKNHFAAIANLITNDFLSELHVERSRFIMWVQMKKVISISCHYSISSWKPWR